MEQEFDAAVEEWLAEVEAELAGKNLKIILIWTYSMQMLS